MSEDRTTPSTLAVALIARDEQEVVVETIQSAAAIADSICVLDTGSTDGTPRVAAALGAQVFHAAWSDDFSAARNELMQHVSCDWILWLDAGERLDPAAVEPMRQFLAKEADPGKAYLVALELPAADGRGLAEQVFVARLVPRSAGLRFAGRVRESMAPAIEDAGLATDFAPCRVLCHPRRHDATRKEAVAERNLRLVELESADSPEPSPARLHLVRGDALADLGRVEEAAASYGEVVAVARCGSVELLEAYYGLLNLPIHSAEELDRRIAAGVEALERFPLDTQLLCMMGSFLHKKGHPDLALRSFEMALRHGEVMLETWHAVDLVAMTTVFYVLALRLAGRLGEAAGVLDQALAGENVSHRLVQHRFEIALQLADQPRGLELATFLFPGQDAPQLEQAVAGACHAAREEWSEAIAQLEAAHAAGCRETFCLRWLVVALVAQRRVDQARAILGEWGSREPGSAEIRALLAGLDEARPTADPSAHAANEQDGPFFRIDQPEQQDGIPGRPSQVAAPLQKSEEGRRDADVS